MMAFSFRQEETFYPARFKRLYFLFPMGSEVVFGISDSDTYEILDGSGSSGPVGEMLLTEDARPFHAGGYDSRPVVRLSMIVHDAETGKEIWKDTVDVRAARITSTSNMANKEIAGVDFDRAVRKGTKEMISRFVQTARAAAETSY
jgi:hypothetical protein